jgi:Na+-driven multidrug efflux pump
LIKPVFDRKVWSLDYLKQILSIGIPSGINQGLMSVSGIITNNLAATYGTVILGSMGIASKVNSLIILILFGLATGCQPLFGYNYGAGNKKRLIAILRTSMILSVAIGAFMLGIFTLVGSHLIAIFSSIPEVVEKGSYMLKAVSSAAPVIGIVMISMNCLQAIGKAVPSLILSTGRQGLYYIPLLFLLNALFGFNGFVFTQPIVDLLMAITAGLMLRWVLHTDPVLNGSTVPGEVPRT